jgi:hypothetical protein
VETNLARSARITTSFRLQELVQPIAQSTNLLLLDRKPARSALPAVLTAQTRTLASSAQPIPSSATDNA